MSDERRGSPRVLVQTKVRLEAGRRVERFSSLNLSSGGVFLETETPVAVGSNVSLKFDLPGAGKVEAQAVVRHHQPFVVQDDGKPGPELRGMGLAFLRVEGDGSQALAEEIKALTLKTK